MVNGMSYHTFLVIAVLSTYISGVLAGFGTSFSIFLPQPDQNFFQKISVTLQVPEPPSPQKSFLYLWPGLDLGSPLFQPVLAGFETPSDYNCSATAEQWCLWLYIYGGSDGGKDAPFVAVSPGEFLDMIIEYRGNDQGYAQTVSRNGEVLSTLEGGAGDGTAHRVQTIVECAGQARGQSPAHTYTNLTMSLGKADQNFDAPNYQYRWHVNTTDLYTQDDGLTWKIDTINMQSSDCEPEINSPAASTGLSPSATPSGPPPSAAAKISDARNVFYACLLVLTIIFLF